jgi:hypothetical protein
METKSPTFKALTLETFSKSVCVEVPTFMLLMPAARNIPGRFPMVKLFASILEATLAVIHEFIKRTVLVLSCGGVPETRAELGATSTI